MRRADSPTTASLLGYRWVVKAATLSILIVMKRLNALRGSAFAGSGNCYAERQFDGIATTWSDKTKDA